WLTPAPGEETSKCRQMRPARSRVRSFGPSFYFLFECWMTGKTIAGRGDPRRRAPQVFPDVNLNSAVQIFSGDVLAGVVGHQGRRHDRDDRANRNIDRDCV